jgi:hypothetical protein
MLMLSFFLMLNSQSSFALEAMNPVSLCGRMINASEKKECEMKAKKLKLDWYAATACNAVNDNKIFMNCWQNVSGAEFNPEALGRCVENPDDNDDVIYKCIVSLKNVRLPASLKKPYQTLEIKKKKGTK